MRLLSIYTVLLSFILLGCGGPQELGNVTNPDSGDVCTTGPNCGGNRDPSAVCALGLNCETDTPPNAPCDQVCQQNKLLLQQRIADSMLLGGSAIGGRSYPGVNTLIKKKILAFTNANGQYFTPKNGLDGLTSGLADRGVTLHRLPDALCKAKGANFYLYTFGDISYAQTDASGNISATTRVTKTDINFEMCGKVGTNTTPEAPANGGAIKVFYYGTTWGAVNKTALASEVGQSSSTFSLTPSAIVTIPSPLPTKCSSASTGGRTLYDRMGMILSVAIDGDFVKMVKDNGEPVTGSYTVDKLYDSWKRPRLDFACDRIAPEAFYDIAGFWVKA